MSQFAYDNFILDSVVTLCVIKLMLDWGFVYLPSLIDSNDIKK